MNLYCVICGHKTYDQYMLYEETWKEAGLKKSDNAHVACVRKKLGRSLKITDFTDSHINNTIMFGYKMGRNS